MKKALLLVVAALMLIPTMAFADNPADTAYNVIITAEGTQNVLKYTDTSGSTKADVTTETIAIAVAPMYGFSPLADLTDRNPTTPTVPLTYVYTITNQGNNSDVIRVKMNVTESSATGWTYKVTEEGGITTTLTKDAWYNLASLGEDNSRLVYVTVTPSPTQGNSPNGAWARVNFEVNTISTPAGVYYGANGYTYGGTFESTDVTITTIETAVLTMSRVATVDAPIQSAGKFTGDAHAAVPGAVITYTITVSNEGSGNGVNAIIVDKVPDPGVKTTAAHVGATGAQIGPNVSISALGDTADNWTAYYTTQASPNTTAFGPGTDWVTIGATPVSRSLTLESGVTYVKWEKETVADTEDGKTLTWGVTIR